MILHERNCSDFGIKMTPSNLPDKISDGFVMAIEQTKAEEMIAKFNTEQRQTCFSHNSCLLV